MEDSFFKKLKIKSKNRILVLNAPGNLTDIFCQDLSDVFLTTHANLPFDVLIIFAITKAELNQTLEKYRSKIDEKILVWIFYPKVNSPLASDLNMMKSWHDVTKHQLVPCASAAVNTDWTGIRLKIEGTVKKSGIANKDIAQNDYGKYINIANKTVTLPQDVSIALQKEPIALAYFKRLAYSHQKEYVLWILTAKQEKTRLDRIFKMVEKLKTGKKNPAEK